MQNSKPSSSTVWGLSHMLTPPKKAMAVWSQGVWCYAWLPSTSLPKLSYNLADVNFVFASTTCRNVHLDQKRRVTGFVHIPQKRRPFFICPSAWSLVSPSTTPVVHAERSLWLQDLWPLHSNAPHLSALKAWDELHRSFLDNCDANFMYVIVRISPVVVTSNTISTFIFLLMNWFAILKNPCSASMKFWSF